MAVRVGINGFGRIGRMVFKAAIDDPDIEIVAVNDLTDVKTLAHLLAFDSIHGSFGKEIVTGDNAFIVGGKKVKVLA